MNERRRRLAGLVGNSLPFILMEAYFGEADLQAEILELELNLRSSAHQNHTHKVLHELVRAKAFPELTSTKQ